MVSWSENLYFGESIKKKHRRVMYAINHGKRTNHVYCIAFASNEMNLFDILPANELCFSHYKNTKTHILGLAGDKDEATDVVVKMLIEIYRNTGEFNVREYFASK